MTGVNTEIPQLKIEVLANGCIRLENTDCGESYAVDVHPTQLRYLAEKMGLTVPAADAGQARRVDKLNRRLKLLHDRMLQLDRWLWQHPDTENADITTEIWYSAGTLELSNEFQTEIAEQAGANPIETVPFSGVFNTPVFGTVSTDEQAVSQGTNEGQLKDMPGTKARARPAALQQGLLG